MLVLPISVGESGMLTLPFFSHFVSFHPQRIMAAVQLVFLRRPYFTGDLVQLGGDTKSMPLTVSRVNLLETTLIQLDAGGEVIIDNAKMLEYVINWLGGCFRNLTRRSRSARPCVEWRPGHEQRTYHASTRMPNLPHVSTFRSTRQLGVPCRAAHGVSGGIVIIGIVPRVTGVFILCHGRTKHIQGADPQHFPRQKRLARDRLCR